MGIRSGIITQSNFFHHYPIDKKNVKLIVFPNISNKDKDQRLCDQTIHAQRFLVEYRANFEQH